MLLLLRRWLRGGWRNFRVPRALQVTDHLPCEGVRAVDGAYLQHFPKGGGVRGVRCRVHICAQQPLAKLHRLCCTAVKDELAVAKPETGLGEGAKGYEVPPDNFPPRHYLC
jgi:hypothetical protein